MSNTTGPRSEPVQARSALRRARLLDAARELVHEDGGIDAITTAKVAERAEASIGTVYRYWSDVHAILDEVLPGRRQVQDVLRERTEQVAAGYTAEHDDEHGIDHLLWEADRRVRRYSSLVSGERHDLVAAIAIGLAALEAHDRAHPTTTDQEVTA